MKSAHISPQHSNGIFLLSSSAIFHLLHTSLILGKKERKRKKDRSVQSLVQKRAGRISMVREWTLPPHRVLSHPDCARVSPPPPPRCVLREVCNNHVFFFFFP